MGYSYFISASEPHLASYNNIIGVKRSHIVGFSIFICIIELLETISLVLLSNKLWAMSIFWVLVSEMLGALTMSFLQICDM